MGEVIWKSFKLDDLFEFITVPGSLTLKNYNLVDEAQDNYIKVVTSSKNTSYKYINKDDLNPTIPIFNNQLTINKNGSVGYSFYHDYDFVATADTCILSYKNKDLKN
ncbi:restriction endonuclease subunit S [Mycoplasma iguanae]|uniref:Restriction endonuclease subunit S n=1 Tax=Mycoplasma iguanae TaxID=292461 RepID=A0ABY5R7X3_9MOLU|nr:restriction endonuclease subunit S [Mycoplasma iguanae]UVD81554.1 restriction endonuclease subunit S [Mycoplasma iguanae]